jgi:DNA polymerase-3 subunit delta'
MSDLAFDVVGAEGPRRYFEALTPATLAHAYLFTGEAGVGKKTFARRLAQSLLCRAPKDGVIGYDGTCASCALFSAQNARHPDFLEHEGALKIGDSDAATSFGDGDDLTARDIVRQLSMQSYSGGLRVLLLGDVDFATHHAPNALLKFFEEPPRGVVLLLTTATPGRLLSTIRSRLIEVRFPLLSRGQLGELLHRMHYSDEDAQLGASLGQGSVTRAVAALDPQEESLRSQVVRWFFEVAAGSPTELSWATRDTLDEGLATIKALVRDWIVTGVSPALPLIALDRERELRALPPLGQQRAAALLAKLDDAARLARTNVSPAMVSEIVRMALTPATRGA